MPTPYSSGKHLGKMLNERTTTVGENLARVWYSTLGLTPIGFTESRRREYLEQSNLVPPSSTREFIRNIAAVKQRRALKSQFILEIRIVRLFA